MRTILIVHSSTSVLIIVALTQEDENPTRAAGEWWNRPSE
jgi:hypothetical protein